MLCLQQLVYAVKMWSALYVPCTAEPLLKLRVDWGIVCCFVLFRYP